MNQDMVELLWQANQKAGSQDENRQLYNSLAANIVKRLKSLVDDGALMETGELQVQIDKALQGQMAVAIDGIAETNYLLRALLNGFLNGWPSSNGDDPEPDPFQAMLDLFNCSQPAPVEEVPDGGKEPRGDTVEVG